MPPTSKLVPKLVKLDAPKSGLDQDFLLSPKQGPPKSLGTLTGFTARNRRDSVGAPVSVRGDPSRFRNAAIKIQSKENIEIKPTAKTVEKKEDIKKASIKESEKKEVKKVDVPKAKNIAVEDEEDEDDDDDEDENEDE